MRADGKRVKNVDPMYTLAPYFMRNRSDAQNAITVTVPYDNVHDYVLDARKRGYKFSHLTVVLSAIIRAVSEFPELNRFVVNSKIYAHNELKIAMVVLRPSDNNPSMSKMKFDLYDTVFDVNEKVEAFIAENNQSTSNTKVDKLFKTLVGCGPLMRFALAVIRGLDKLGWLPKAITDLSPFHGSLCPCCHPLSCFPTSLGQRQHGAITLAIVTGAGQHANLFQFADRSGNGRLILIAVAAHLCCGNTFRKADHGQQALGMGTFQAEFFHFNSFNFLNTPVNGERRITKHFKSLNHKTTSK